MTEPMFLYGIFANLQLFPEEPRIRGHFPVIVERLLDTSKDHWGEKQWAAYQCCGFEDKPLGAHNHHVPYAYCSASILAEIEVSASGPFELQVGPWSRCNTLRSLEATMRYRGYEGFDDSLLPGGKDA
jgi:hypothetical protein